MKKRWTAILAVILMLSMLLAAVPAQAAEASGDQGSDDPVKETLAPVAAQNIPRITEILPVQGGVKISFTAYPGAAMYRIFTKKADGSGWKGIANTTSLSYVRTGAPLNKTEVYTVRALDWYGRFCSSFDAVGYTFTYLPTPKPKAESVLGGVKISWDAVEGAPGYRVYVKNGKDWKGIANTTSASFLRTDVASGTSDTYTVRVYDPERKQSYSYYDRTGATVKYIEAPEITYFVPVQGGTKVTWNAVEGGVRYRLFYHNGTSWKTIGTTAGTTLTHSDLTGGTNYRYTVRVTDQNGKYISGYNPEGWTYRYNAPPHIVAVTPMSGDLHMYWMAAPYAAAYRVYRKIFGETWVSLGQTSTLSFTDRNVRGNTLYTYTLRSVDDDDRLNSYFETDTVYYYNGQPADGTLTVNGAPVCFVKGYLRQGYVTISGKTYYYNASGTLMKDGIVGSEKDGYAYADRNGVVDTHFTGIAKSGSTYWYLKNGKVDTSARIAVSYDGSQWNVLNGKARKVVTEEDKVLYRALNLVNKITNSSMTKEQKLRAMWNYIRDAYVEKNPRIPHYHGMDWPIIYANDMLINGVGNCMSYGAEFCYIAKAIGYDECYACHSGGHGWAEIDGLIYDVEWSRHVFTYNYYALSYDTKVDQDYKGAISSKQPWMHIKVCADYD